MSEASTHVIKSYEQELQRLRGFVAEMGGMVKAQVALARNAVVKP